MISRRSSLSKKWLLILVGGLLPAILLGIAWGILGLREALIQWTRTLAPYLVLIFSIAMGYKAVKILVWGAGIVWDRMRIFGEAGVSLFGLGMILLNLAIIFDSGMLGRFALLLVLLGVGLGSIVAFSRSGSKVK